MKTKRFLIFFLATMGFVFSSAAKADTYTCSANGKIYSDSNTCNASCNQSANCSLNTVSLSGSGTAFETITTGRSGGASGTFDISSSDSILNIGGVNVAFSGCTISGSGVTSGNIVGIRDNDFNGTINVTSLGSNLKIGGVNLTFTGCTVSGSGIASEGSAGARDNNPSGRLNITSSGSNLKIGGVNLTFSPNVYSCPLTGGSSCSGAPQTCTAQTACTLNQAVNGACGSANGQPANSLPTAGLCDSGKLSGPFITASGWWWVCMGSNGGVTASCSTGSKAVCGANPDVSNSLTLCQKGSLNGSNVAGTGSVSDPWTWTCFDNDLGGVNANCSAISPVPSSVCGNGTVENGEQCDLGTGNGSCPSACSSGCTLNNCAPTPVCGNNIKEVGEQCDEGANNGGCPKACSSSCTLNSCGISTGNWKEIAP